MVDGEIKTVLRKHVQELERSLEVYRGLLKEVEKHAKEKATKS